MPITTGVIPPHRVLDEEEDVCEYLYAEGMASLERCVVCLKEVNGRWTSPTTSIVADPVSTHIHVFPPPNWHYRKKEQERQQAAELRKQASAKYTRGISEALVKVMKERGTWCFGSIDWCFGLIVCVYVCVGGACALFMYPPIHQPTQHPHTPTTAYGSLFVSLFPNPVLASKEARLDLASATLERVTDPALLKALVLVLGRKGTYVHVCICACRTGHAGRGGMW